MHDEVKQIEVGPGYGLLTTGVGGTEANWRDRALARAILSSQDRKMVGFEPTRSHAELCTDPIGETLGIRWRTRTRKNGLADYIGCDITIARLFDPITPEEHTRAWKLADMQALDGKVYPVLRIALLGLTSTILPGWFDNINLFGDWAMCSEGTARYYWAIRQLRLQSHGPQYLRFVEEGWKGIMPVHLEQAFGGREFEIVFRGRLTSRIMAASGLPDYRGADGRAIALVPGD